MLKILKRTLAAVVVLALLATALVYAVLSLSLPALDGEGKSDALTQPLTLERDKLGQAVIHAENRLDAAYGLGYAHGQDRFFQMDLLRRNAAGELSELFGRGALELDKRRRFHQLRKHAEVILASLSEYQRKLLEQYSRGVNEGLAQTGYPSFEYILTGADAKLWLPEDSILVIYSMYLDLQEGTVKRDWLMTHLQGMYGDEMLAFLTQPSRYQAALDNSLFALETPAIPELETGEGDIVARHIEDIPEVGSNNWAVTGALTGTGAGMLSDDMHLSIAVPVIWYRAQLNYREEDKSHQVTGVSLPGAPAIVVGTNRHIAWGFTNGYLDTADWIRLEPDTQTWIENEAIALPGGESESFALEMSEFGPVRELDGQRYALSWVAYQPYAVNMTLSELERAENVEQAMAIAPSAGIPVQNLMVVDKQGSAGWQPMGAVPGRLEPSETAIAEAQYSPLWRTNEVNRPRMVNPDNGRLWTGNARVMSVDDMPRFGNGGYALGARAMQIRDRLNESESFDEAGFYRIQLDNEARFLAPWHTLLVALLEQDKAQYGEDLQALAAWRQCACADSLGYTLVRRFRDHALDTSFAPISMALEKQQLSLSQIKRDLEPALWQLIERQPQSWLAGRFDSWDELLLGAYQNAKEQLKTQFGADMNNWQWGKVNELAIRHPFSKQIPLLSRLLDMPRYPGFGDSFMPAVQKPGFGASQRLIVQPGHEEQGILTVPGGQSGHPLSEYYRAGFDAYAKGLNTPLLPGEIRHRITLMPQ